MFKELGDKTPVSYALRYAASFPNVFMVLSGMSDMDMLLENMDTMYPFVPLNRDELDALGKAKNIIREYNQIPCTKCRYCTELCPKKVPIPELFEIYNEYAFAHRTKDDTAVALSSFDVKAIDCIACGRCESVCPQSIDIREKLNMLAKF